MGVGICDMRSVIIKDDGLVQREYSAGRIGIAVVSRICRQSACQQDSGQQSGNKSLRQLFHSAPLFFKERELSLPLQYLLCQLHPQAVDHIRAWTAVLCGKVQTVGQAI